MFPQFVAIGGLAAAGAMASPVPNRTNYNVPMNATNIIINTATATTPQAVATAIASAPEVFGDPSKNDTANTVVVETTTAPMTPLQELTHIVDRASDKVHHIMTFVKRAIDLHGHHISEEHARHVADAIALPMAVLHSLLDHVTEHIRNMCHGPHGHHLLSGLPAEIDAGIAAVAGAHPEVMALLDKTRAMLSEIHATMRHLIQKFDLDNHILDVLHPVIVASGDLLFALENHLTGAGKEHAAVAGSSDEACKECGEGDEDSECCSSHGHGLRAGLKQKLRNMAVRYLHRHFRSIFRFLLGDLEDIIDNAEEYYDAYDDRHATTACGSSCCDPQALALLMAHIDKAGETMELVQLARDSPEVIEELFADKGEEAEDKVEADSE